MPYRYVSQVKNKISETWPCRPLQHQPQAWSKNCFLGTKDKAYSQASTPEVSRTTLPQTLQSRLASSGIKEFVCSSHLLPVYVINTAKRGAVKMIDRTAVVRITLAASNKSCVCASASTNTPS